MRSFSMGGTNREWKLKRIEWTRQKEKKKNEVQSHKRIFQRFDLFDLPFPAFKYNKYVVYIKITHI
ncbi:Uncharacterized protein APZ42_027492 [Daphnia magna]|uniref:Uncharacterized protein n=1 Tax=Daphnia magna TaxID=35525 RepID=A0A164RME9_9CRUS|nr:Uncharacterized protein APZ42_027492 [Daphnia magna]